MEFVKTITNYHQLGDSPVGIDTLCRELSRIPLDGILGYLTMFSLELVTAEEGPFSHAVQDKYFIMALEDE